MRGSPYECIRYLTECDPDKAYEVKEVKKRRSLTQNAYYWALLNKLARALGMGDTETHLNMLREYGVAELVSVSPEVPIGDYFKYWDDLGCDFVGGEERRTVKLYKGSSHMDSSEFSKLINGMREECVLQGIDVATPEEIARMEYIEGK